MEDLDLSRIELEVTLGIVKIVLVLVIAFYVFSHLFYNVVIRKDFRMSDEVYSVTKTSVELPNVGMSRPDPIKLQHLEDTRTREERNRDKVYLYSHMISKQYDIEPSLIIAIAQKESRFDPNAEGSGAKGLMQIIPSCHGDRISRLGVTDIWDPYSNLLIGADLIAELISKYKDPGLALMCYNMGEGTALYRFNNNGYSGYALEVLRIKEEIERSELYATYSHQERNTSSESGNS